MVSNPISVHVDRTNLFDFVSHRLEIIDEDLLAKILCEVALGKSIHAAEIIAGKTHAQEKSIRIQAAQSARKLFDLQANGAAHHRDGWMMQIISWVASQEIYRGALQQAPHIRHAHKGLDGICIALNADKTGVDFCVISEDKATTNAQSTFRHKVIPEFEQIEQGTETSLLTESISSLLLRAPIADRDSAVETILWDGQLRFRAMLTIVDPDQEKPAGRIKLFKGFKTSIPGQNDRRIAATFHHPEIRTWFSELAQKCQDLLDQRAAEDA